MGDFFSDNLWEEEPDFARDDDGNGDDRTDTLGGNDNFGAQHVIALVDCHPDMFVPINGTEPKEQRNGHANRNTAPRRGDDDHVATPFYLSLQLVQTLMQQTIEQTVIRKSGKRNGIGLLLYNTTLKRKGGMGHSHDKDDDDDDDDKMDDEDEDEDNGGDDNSDAPDQGCAVHELLDLVPPGIQHVQTLQNLVEKRGRDLKEEFCPKLDEEMTRIAPLQTAIEDATRKFITAKCVKDPNKSTKDNEFDHRSIWIFTNQANPYPHDSMMQLVYNVANEAKEQRINITVWPLGCGDTCDAQESKELFTSPFFDNLVSEKVFERRLQSMTELEDGLEEITRSMRKNRRAYFGPMHILSPSHNENDKDNAIMIDWYPLIQLAKRPGKVQIDDENKRETLKIRLVLEKDTGKEVAKSYTAPNVDQRDMQKNQPGLKRLRQFYDFAGELIPVSKGDMEEMLLMANAEQDPGLTILGFKPRGSIPFYHSVSDSYLIYPNDDVVQGSREAFAQLHAAMMRKNVLAIGETLHRSTWQSRLVAIIPFQEISSEDNYLAPCMIVTQLPFEDDVRAVVPDEASKEIDRERESQKLLENAICSNPDAIASNRDILTTAEDYWSRTLASKELVSAAMDLIRRQDLSSVELGLDFENAALTEFYSYLKSVAFNTTHETQSFDTRLDEELVLRVAKREIDTFASRLPADIEKSTIKVSRKRLNEDLPTDESGIDWKELHDGGKIGTCKIDQLKQFLRSVGLAVSGRKDELVSRVSHYLEEKKSSVIQAAES